jgi:hypothetical protein
MGQHASTSQVHHHIDTHHLIGSSDLQREFDEYLLWQKKLTGKKDAEWTRATCDKLRELLCVFIVERIFCVGLLNIVTE